MLNFFKLRNGYKDCFLIVTLGMSFMFAIIQLGMTLEATFPKETEEKVEKK